MNNFRMLEVTPISGEDLKDVKMIGKMQTYVVAWVDPTRKASTNLDKQGGKNPNWNDRLQLAVDERLLNQPKSMLVLEILSKGGFSNTVVGRVNVPLHEVSEKASGSIPFSYKVRRPSGRFQGVLHVSIKLGDKIEQPAEPAVAYPAASQHQGIYPPPPQQGGYHGYPPQQPGYPPQQGVYPPQQGGYPPQQYYPPAGAPVVAPQMAAQTRPGRFGGGGYGGLGMGLAGGLLGGLLVGEMLDNDNDYGGGGDWGGGGGDWGGGDFGGGW